MEASFYRREGAAFVPSELARSPWQDGMQNGAALGGLLAHLIDEVPSPAPMTVARLTIDILGAAPAGVTQGRTRVVREGARMQLVDAELVVGEVCVARATALRTREAASPAMWPPVPEVPAPESIPRNMEIDRMLFGGTVDTRPIRGGIDQSGPGAMWVRFGNRVVEGVPLSVLSRIAVLGDFGGGLSGAFDREEWIYPNLDIVIQLLRMPERDWLMTDAVTYSAGNGIAQSRAILADESGVFGTAHQTLFIAPRHTAQIAGGGAPAVDKEKSAA